MLAVGNMSHGIPNHVLRVGQSIRLDPSLETANECHLESSRHVSDPELDTSLEHLNQLILELDPTFEPIQVKKSPPCISSYKDDSSPDEDCSGCVLVPRGCPPGPAPLRSVPIPTPTRMGPSCSPHGSLVFCDSPSSSRPPLPCTGVRRRDPSARAEACSSQASLRMACSNRNSSASLLSMSPGSDTSYILGSTLSLASEDADSAESLLTRTSGSFSNNSIRSLETRPSPTKPSMRNHFHELQSNGILSSPASLAGSLTDIPVVLVNGAPERHQEISPRFSPQEMPSKPCSPHSFQAHFHGSQPSMKFVMDTSKFWFRPVINRAEAEALVKDKQPGTFVVRDSTSYRGCFGLAMKVEHAPDSISPTGHSGESSSEQVRHFLIESSAKGVRIKGSSQEPYFGSLSALVYQHSITSYALPCKLLLQTHDVGAEDEGSNDRTVSDIKTKTACNFLYLNTVPTEMLTGPCAIQRAVCSTLDRNSGAIITPTIVNFKVSQKGVTLTDINRKLFFRRHYPAHLLSYSGEDPDKRLWLKDIKFGARMFGFVAKGVEAGMENVCHVFAEYDPLQPCDEAIECIRGAMAKL